MLILPVYLRENMKSQLDKKEAREGKAKFGRQKVVSLKWGLSGCRSCVASWMRATDGEGGQV